LKINKIYNEDCLEGMKRMNDNFIDLTVTSPPYDNLRNYNGYTFNFEGIAKELYRVTKNGGIVVWVVGDATIKGTETGTSFRQALYFKEIGFNLHDTMIWNKENCASVGSLNRYENVFEYMFVLSKGKPKTANIIKDKPNKRAGELQNGSIRLKDGTVKKTSNYGKKKKSEFGRRSNVWSVFPAKSKKERLHPAPFSEILAEDHILSWSNKNDIILDPFIGSGTTAKMAKLNNRNYIGFDVSSEYVKIANNRIIEAYMKKEDKQ
jgi:site-specific DNA-methyltransferase (adenine-specific)